MCRPWNKSPETLICAGEAFPGQSVDPGPDPGPARLLRRALATEPRITVCSRTWSCGPPDAVIRRSAWGGQPVTWRDLATAADDPLLRAKPATGPAMDAQGVINEQATGYANFDLGLWTTAEQRPCRVRPPRCRAWITAADRADPDVPRALATQPDGKAGPDRRHVRDQPTGPGGDPAAVRGDAGSAADTPPAQRVAVYSGLVTSSAVLGGGTSRRLVTSRFTRCGSVPAGRSTATTITWG